MSCTCSPSLMVLRGQLDATYPHRSIAADGCCGDARHQREVSDHNPDRRGYAHAYDITHDPAHGVRGDAIAAALLEDSRTKYVIWNRRIWNPSVSRSWRPYHGADPHTGHVHLSIVATATLDRRAWPIGQPAPLPGGDDMTQEQAQAILDGQHALSAQLTDVRAKLERMGLDNGRFKKRLGIADQQDAATIQPMVGAEH